MRRLLVFVPFAAACAPPPARSPEPAVPDPVLVLPVEPQAPEPAPPPASEPAAPAAAPEPPPPPLPPRGLSGGSDSPVDRALAEGDEAYAKDELEKAALAYKRAERLAPKAAAPKLGLIRVALAKTGIPTEYAAAPGNAKLIELLAKLDAAQKLEPGHGVIELERGRVSLMLGRAAPALEALRRATALVPDDPEAFSALGVALLATGDATNALASLKRAVELDRGSAERQRVFGAAALVLGDVSTAISAFRAALELAPDDVRTRADLGTAYLAGGYVDEATHELERALAADPGRASLHSNFAYARLLKGDLDTAEQHARKATLLDPKLGSAWINLGLVLAKRGEYPQAKAAFIRAQSLDPDDPRPKENLKELEAEMTRPAGPGIR